MPSLRASETAMASLFESTTKIADAAYEGTQLIGDKALSQEYADVTPAGTESHLLGEDEDDVARNEIQVSAGAAADSIEDAEDEEIDLNAALGGGIRKAPAAETEEPTPADIEQVISA